MSINARELMANRELMEGVGRTYDATPKASNPVINCLCGAVPTVKQEVDVVLIGGGIMSATLGVMLLELEPTWRVHIYEALPNAGEEASNGWNNAGTGHAALCELNYTTENKETGKIDISKAIAINEQFQVSRQLWAYLVKKELLPKPTTFINRTPHMSFVQGEENVDFLRRRCELLQKQPLFEGMEFTSDVDKIREWAPLLLQGRETSKGAEPIACTRVEEGTDVDYGTLTKHLVRAFIAKGGVYQSLSSAQSFKQDADGKWRVNIHKEDLSAGGTMELRAPFVFIGAGGATIQLLQKTGIPEIQGFGAFPISGQFLCCQNPEIVAKHPSKIYGMASVGAPPMSVPHLDARIVDGQPMVLFGPFAGFSPRYLKSSGVTDLVSTIRCHNLIPMTAAGLQNLDLVVYLIKELLASKEDKLQALRKFIPDARPEDWGYTWAGQRVQIMKKDPKKIGILQFGTEVVSSADGSMCGLLGASPGASISVQVGLDVLESCFPSRIPGWKAKLCEMIPSFGETLNSDATKARQNMAYTAKVLELWGKEVAAAAEAENAKADTEAAAKAAAEEVAARENEAAAVAAAAAVVATAPSPSAADGNADGATAPYPVADLEKSAGEKDTV